MNLLLAALFAWQTATTPTLPAIRGTVISATTKEPLRKAEVRLDGGRGSGAQVAVTGPDGRFEFKNVSPGTYGITARRNGFVVSGPGGGGMMGPAMARMPSRPSARVEVSGEDVSGIVIPLVPQSVIAGKILDEDGEPLQGVVAQALTMRGVRGERRLMPAASVTTDDRGEFRLTNLNPGSYILQVSPARWGGAPAQAAENDLALGYVPMYYPGNYDPGQAERIRLSAGTELAGLQIRLSRTRVYRLRGRVLDPDGQPARQYSLQLVPAELPSFGPRAEQVNRMPDGSFEVRNVVPGSYMLVVRTQTGDARRVNPVGHKELLQVGSQDIDNLVIRMNPVSAVTGRVKLSSPMDGFDPGRIQISLTDPLLFFGGANANVQADGTFRLEGVAPGSYRLAIAVPFETVYVDSIRMGGTSIPGRDIEIPAGGGQPIEVVLDHGGGAVDAKAMLGDKALPGASIVLLPRDKRLWGTSRVRIAKTNSEGAAAIANVAPGDYLAFAFDEYEDGVWEDDEQFRLFESKGTKLSISKGQSATVTLNAFSVGS
jgi:protocatechuate 3,4-dioxygenase beta subunit